MKNKILILLTVFMGSLLLNACYEETSLFHSPEAGDGQYAQLFSTEMQYDINKLNALGEPADLDVAVDVRLLGELPTSDLTVSFEITTDDLPEGYTAASADMYSFAANEFVIPAGQDYSSVTLTLINAEIPLESGVSFILRLKDGTAQTASTAGEMIITLYKKDFCPYAKEDLVGDWAVLETGAYKSEYVGTYHITAGEGDTLWFTESFWFTGPGTIWGETVTDIGDPVPVIFDDSDVLNPNVYMGTPQYLMTTDDSYEYWIADWNTYDGNSDNPWVYSFCAKTLYMNFYIPYAAPDGGLVDICEVTLDYSGTKKVAHVTRTTVKDHPKFINKK